MVWTLELHLEHAPAAAATPTKEQEQTQRSTGNFASHHVVVAIVLDVGKVHASLRSHEACWSQGLFATSHAKIQALHGTDTRPAR